MSYQQIGGSVAQAAAPMLSENASSLFQREKLRSVREFFGLDSGMSAWSVPSPSNFTGNISYFQLNYMLVAAVIMSINLLLTTRFIDWIGLAVLGAVWFWFVKTTAASSGTISVAGKEIPEKQAAVVLGVISLVAIFVLCGHAIWHAFLQCALVCGVHAALRKAPSEDAGLIPTEQV